MRKKGFIRGNFSERRSVINVDIVNYLTQVRAPMHRAIAAYEETIEWLGEVVSGMELDIAALQRPLRRCQLEKCGGTCCYDGAYLGSEEADVIRGVAGDSRADFERLGLDLPDQVIVFGSWQGSLAGPKTATRPTAMRERVSDYPAHFPQTSCVFLLEDARCSLQVIAQERDLPPWFYKPVTCWMHPLTMEGIEEGKPILTLHDERNDPQRSEGYDGFVSHTHCGRTCEGGESAFRILEDELCFLGGLAGRDLIAEIEGEATETV
jgi:hypothetical protein